MKFAITKYSRFKHGVGFVLLEALVAAAIVGFAIFSASLLYKKMLQYQSSQSVSKESSKLVNSVTNLIRAYSKTEAENATYAADFTTPTNQAAYQTAVMAFAQQLADRINGTADLTPQQQAAAYWRDWQRSGRRFISVRSAGAWDSNIVGFPMEVTLCWQNDTNQKEVTQTNLTPIVGKPNCGTGITRVDYVTVNLFISAY